jgi:hypothetical protein
LIVFPEDPSTSFLDDIIKYLGKSVDSTMYDVVRVKPAEEFHEETLKEIQNPQYKAIAFFGHGTSVSLYGARSADYKNENFIATKQFNVFKEKELILVSCDSSILLKKNKNAGFSNSIGFGDLPTDWNDIQSAREVDANAYNGFTEENLTLFKACLVEIVKFSLTDYLRDKLTIKELFDLIILRTNKRIVSFFLENKSSHSTLSDCLLRMKHQTLYFGQP